MNIARIVYLTLVILIAAALINFARGGEGFHIAKVLPFASGETPGIYDWAGIAIVLITLWGIQRLRRNRNSSTREEDRHES